MSFGGNAVSSSINSQNGCDGFIRKKMTHPTLKVLIIGLFLLSTTAFSQTEFWKTGAQANAMNPLMPCFMAESLFAGASFIYQDKSSDIIVSLYKTDAWDTGVLYFCIPGKDSLYYLFRNLKNGSNPTIINLSKLFTIPVGTEICFAYRTTKPYDGTVSFEDTTPKYTGPNLPASQYITKVSNDSYGKRWAVAGRIKTPGGIPTDSVEFGFEDSKSGDIDFNDIVFHARGLGLNIEKPPLPKLDSSVVYDKTGDGIADYLTLFFRDSVFGGSIKRVSLEWPPLGGAKQVALASLSMLDKKTCSFSDIGVSQFCTRGTGRDTAVLDSFGVSVFRADSTRDGIGPLLIHEALLVERFTPGNDTLFVKFSENVNIDAIADTAFILIKNKGQSNERRIKLTLLGQATGFGSNDSIRFLLPDLGLDAPKAGDYVAIYSTGTVVDLPRKNHSHPDNTPVPIRLINKEIPSISKSVIYDANGDGIGDSVTAFFTDAVDTAKLSAFHLKWPTKSTDTINLGKKYHRVTDKSISIPFTPAISAGIATTGEGTIFVSFKSTPNTIIREQNVEDGIGPLLRKNKAFVVERFTDGNDTFLVTLTERVRVSAITGESFFLIKKGSQKKIILSVLGIASNLQGDTAISFAARILNAGDAPASGDSIQIFDKGPVEDFFTNRAHPNNTPVELIAIKRPIPITGAAYYDEDGNGVVDQVRIQFAGRINDLQSISVVLEWLVDGEKGVVKKLEYDPFNSNGIIAYAEDIFGQILSDRTGGEMNAFITFKQAGNSIGMAPVADKAGPVIIAAAYCPFWETTGATKNDTLRVRFSEEVLDINPLSREPFEFITSENIPYTMKLQQIAHAVDSAAFLVESIIGIPFPQQRDSIWINHIAGVSDNKKTTQNVEKNKRVWLTIKQRPFIFRIIVLGPVDPVDFTIPDSIRISDKIVKGIVIMLTPNIQVPDHIFKNTGCKISVYDPLGNLLVKGEEFENYNQNLAVGVKKVTGKNRIVVNWNGKNAQGRCVGGGEYFAKVVVSLPDGGRQVFSAVIPVKKNRR
jgi:hypothetical protein